MSDYARKRRIYRRANARIMPDNDGALTLAGAICLLAATQHSEDAGHQEQIAACFYDMAISGFNGVRTNEAVTAFVTDMMKRVQK